MTDHPYGPRVQQEHDPGGGFRFALCVVLIIAAMWTWSRTQQPGVVHVKPASQASVQHERNARYEAEAALADTVELLDECRLERAQAQVEGWDDDQR